MQDRAMSEGNRFLASELERLRALSLSSKADAEVWRAEVAALERQLTTRFPDLEFPHEIWHYLSDADIRVQEPEYGAMQEQVLTDYITSVRGLGC
jgi:hypothetical protein